MLLWAFLAHLDSLSWVVVRLGAILTRLSLHAVNRDAQPLSEPVESGSGEREDRVGEAVSVIDIAPREPCVFEGLPCIVGSCALKFRESVPPWFIEQLSVPVVRMMPSVQSDCVHGEALRTIKGE